MNALSPLCSKRYFLMRACVYHTVQQCDILVSPLLYDLYFLQHITITYEGKCFPRSSDLENASNK